MGVRNGDVRELMLFEKGSVSQLITVEGEGINVGACHRLSFIDSEKLFRVFFLSLVQSSIK